MSDYHVRVGYPLTDDALSQPAPRPLHLRKVRSLLHTTAEYTTDLRGAGAGSTFSSSRKTSVFNQLQRLRFNPCLFQQSRQLAVMAGFYDSIKTASGVYKYYADGEWKESTSGKTVSIIDPTTREVAYKVQGTGSTAMLTHWKLSLCLGGMVGRTQSLATEANHHL